MKYHEIVAASDRPRQGNIVRIRNQTSVKQIGPKFVEAAINRLYDDLMGALEGRMMNIEPYRKER
jgi:hypothetical protein